MKTALLIAASFFVTLTAQAKGTKYICKEVGDFGPKKSLVLTQVSDREIKEGVKERFLLEVFEGSEKEPSLSVNGFVTTEDVMFQFKSSDRKVSAMIYLDEMEESSLAQGRKTTSFDCN
jgi:hypothetical protein